MLTESSWKEKISKLRQMHQPPDKEKLKQQIIATIKAMATGKVALLLSGGVDSSLIALILHQLNKDFVCYTVGFPDAEDMQAAPKVAKVLGLQHKVIELDLNECHHLFNQVTKLLGEANVVKAGVGAVEWKGFEAIKKDGITKVFGGLGTEEIFAGYERHKLAKDINAECWNGLEGMWDRDLKRDLTLAAHFGIELCAPFLEDEIITLAMAFPGEDKIKDGENKWILRTMAEELGLPKETAWRKKKAAQYGSSVDKAMQRLAKQQGFTSKTEYLKQSLS